MAAPSMSTVSYPPQLPPFLKQLKAEVHARFVDLEWQQRDRLLQGTQQSENPTDPPSQWSRLSGDGITARNRYLNVEPFAQNRIKLKVAEGVNDYINASAIQLGTRRYIATQGPKDTSVNHFYRMLAEELASPIVVVMLTQTHEAGREKCFQYYPLSPEESPLVIQHDDEIADGFHGEVDLQSVREDPKSRSEVRTLRLRTCTADTAANEREIHHLLFSGWPDFLIPEGEDRDGLVELVHLSNRLNTSTSTGNPRIIHCSAGVGRSGTFIALDYLLSLMNAGELDHLEPEDRDPIAETVDLLRQQRMMMVQGESQFHFLYEVLREQMIARLGMKNGGTAGGAEAT